MLELEILPVAQAPHASNRPGTTTLPADEHHAVIRISNPQSLVNENVRVQNEVAAMSLMRNALAGEFEDLVPLVYDWAPSSEGRGWILQEYKKGVQLDKALRELGEEEQRDIVRQAVAVYKRIQDYQLPESVQGYGGLQFNSTGTIITGETTIPCGGPFETLSEMYAQMLRRQLDESDTSDRLKGWRNNNGLRDRLERFFSYGIKDQTKKNSMPRRALIHGDYSTWKAFRKQCWLLTYQTPSTCFLSPLPIV